MDFVLERLFIIVLWAKVALALEGSSTMISVNCCPLPLERGISLLFSG